MVRLVPAVTTRLTLLCFQASKAARTVVPTLRSLLRHYGPLNKRVVPLMANATLDLVPEYSSPGVWRSYIVDQVGPARASAAPDCTIDACMHTSPFMRTLAKPTLHWMVSRFAIDRRPPPQYRKNASETDAARLKVLRSRADDYLLMLSNLDEIKVGHADIPRAARVLGCTHPYM